MSRPSRRSTSRPPSPKVSDWNLDIFLLKSEALEESANLPPGIIAQEITDDLEAALEQFATIAGDLKK
jgi:type I restriction enzyme M protein